MFPLCALGLLDVGVFDDAAGGSNGDESGVSFDADNERLQVQLLARVNTGDFPDEVDRGQSHRQLFRRGLFSEKHSMAHPNTGADENGRVLLNWCTFRQRVYWACAAISVGSERE